MDQRKRQEIRIDCISDLHGFYPELSGGDLLIVAGDLTARDTIEQHIVFCDWILKQNYKKIIIICGNHDGAYEKMSSKGFFLSCDQRDKSHISYLYDSVTEFEGLKIWGSPWTPTFYNWHFMKDRGAPIREKWDLIPDDTDILITHGPPYGILDTAPRTYGHEHVGCADLRNAVFRVKPKLHVFGHIHDCGGKTFDTTLTKFVNASIMDEKYRPVNSPIRIVL